jgi:hypothetical protein
MNYPTLHEGEGTFATDRGRDEKMTTHAQHFTSAQQFTGQAMALFSKTAPDEMLTRRGQENEFYNNAQQFNGYSNGFEQRDNVYNHRCDENIRARVHAATLDINQDQTGQQEQQMMDLYYDDSGQFADMNAYFGGEENCMVSIEMQPQTKPIVYIAVCMTSSARWNDEHYLNRGIAVIRAVHALERKGVSVGVLAYAVSRVDDTITSRANRKPQRAIMTVIVKAPENALDESDLINMMTGAGMMRNAGFQNCYYVLGQASSGLGQPQTLTREDIKHAGFDGIEMAVLPYTSDQHRQLTNIDDAVKLLTTEVNKQTSINI